MKQFLNQRVCTANMSSNTIQVRNFTIGGEKTFIIADIGSNHKQDLSLAKESIIAAAEAGADAIKFQSIQLNDLYLKPDAKTTEFIKKLEFPEEWHRILKEFCDERGIIFFSSPTYLKAVDLLEDVDVPLYKLASAQIGTFPQLVEKVAALKKPTIFSTGIAAYEEIIRAVNIFKKYNNDQFIILHCNSIYPTPPERVNLQLMSVYQQMFGNPVGFSDHTEGTTIACAAVSLGARVIEKHFTLDRKLDTPDSNSFACDPAEMKKLVTEIRAIEAATRTWQHRLDIQPEEKAFKNSIQTRLILAHDIQKGSPLSSNDFCFLRSDDGVDCRELSMVINKRAGKDLKKGQSLNYSDLQ
jgi:sialic acid synthase SpsE